MRFPLLVISLAISCLSFSQGLFAADYGGGGPKEGDALPVHPSLLGSEEDERNSAFRLWFEQNDRPFRRPRSTSSLGSSSSEEERKLKTPTRLRGGSLSPSGEKFFSAIAPYLSPGNCSVDFSYALEELLEEDSKGNVVYLTESQRDGFRVYPLFDVGDEIRYKLVWGDGSFVDTKEWSSKLGKGYAAYALSVEGVLYLAEHRSSINSRSINFEEETLPSFQKDNKQEFYHSSFFGGKPGICFGMIRVEEGVITYLDRKSGHYKPSEENFKKACGLLSPFLKKGCHFLLEVSWEHCEADLFRVGADAAW